MDRKTFNPLDWVDFEVPGGQVPGGEGDSSDIASDVESVLRNIEEKKLDITAQYAHWRNIGFGLASAFGEEGRTYFHRVSCFYPRYTKAECDQQYNSCLKGKGNGITLKSFFFYAKEKGIDIGRQEVGGVGQQTGTDVAGQKAMEVKGGDQKGKVPEQPRRKEHVQDAAEPNTASDQRSGGGMQPVKDGGKKVAKTFMQEGTQEPKQNGIQEHIQNGVGKGAVQEPGEVWVPNLPDSIYGEIPEFLKKVVAHAVSGEERDLLLLGSLVALSACLPSFYGIYDGKKVYPNLYLFVTAKASAGKGRLVHCKQLVLPIHYHLRDQAKLLKKEYELLLAEYNQNKNSDGGDKPNRPPEKMLFIPANNSTTGVFQLLHENEGRGIIFETEGDTLAQAFKSDYGNYSDGFRKAFHHETISYYRRTDREYVDIESPCISTILSGTPKQVSALIPNAENGLFSRFIFYYMNIQPVWKDVFSFSAEEESLDAYFKGLGGAFFELYKLLEEHEEVQFVLTPDQQAQFNQFFTIVQDTYVSLKGIDYLATVRRLGLIAFRISMIFSALRLMEHGGMDNRQLAKEHEQGARGNSCLVCEDRDFQVALSMTRILVKHAAKVYSELPEEEPLLKRNNRKERFFECLPKAFSRKDFLAIGMRLSIPDKTADRYINEFCKSGMVCNDHWGQYQKTLNPEI